MFDELSGFNVLTVQTKSGLLLTSCYNDHGGREKD